ncbi:MAG: exodeoxyribonuclease V subunit alpha [Planctomycetes bacterium]|nr:exodeoxyribonuclease V subunit alpha [Planctomycetota bacterium]
MTGLMSLAPHLADLLLRRGALGDTTLLRATLQRLWADREQGHVCLPLAAAAGQKPFPDAATWRRALLATGVVADADRDDRPLPLVLDAQDRLYLRRDRASERALATFVQRRLQEPPRIAANALRADLEALGLLPAAGSEVDWQLVAVAAAARASFAVLTGGPGTGKTTTVARWLAVLARREPSLRVALCAPTGKAAARLVDSLRTAAATLPSLADVLAHCEATTLHRLLGYRPTDDAFARGPERPLRHDVVVVDEASMAEPALLATLCGALPPTARLLLVGDRDQLAAVGAGQPLGDLCRAAAPERGVGRALATFCREALRVELPTQDGAPALADVVVSLRKNHRFATRPGIGGFATAMANRRSDEALAALHAGHADLPHALTIDAALQPFRAAILAAATGDADVDSRLTGFRVLTATRHGPHGASTWNARIEALLRSEGLRTDREDYLGRPILVVANDHQNRLYNGDLGLVVADAQGRHVVAFPRGAEEPRLVPLHRLPQHETAWAMTVHKAQGSEFDDVLLSLPDKQIELLDAPLIYTGVTRGRRRVLVHGDLAVLAPALAHWPDRSSGLAEALRAAR